MEAAVVWVADMETTIVGVYACAVASAAFFGFVAWLRLPRNIYRQATAVSAWLLAVSVVAELYESQFIYLILWLMIAAPIFTALAFIRENRQDISG